MTVSRPMARARITDAATVTTSIADLVIEARSELEEVWSNGHGVLSEPYTTRSELTRARNKLNDALAALDDACWPTTADYDAVN